MIELTTGTTTSLLSTYSTTSGLLNESQEVDIDSSMEIDTLSDFVGDTSMLHGTWTASLLLGTEHAALGWKIALVFALDEAEKEAGIEGPTFFAFATLFVHGT